MAGLDSVLSILQMILGAGAQAGAVGIGLRGAEQVHKMPVPGALTGGRYEQAVGDLWNADFRRAFPNVSAADLREIAQGPYGSVVMQALGEFATRSGQQEAAFQEGVGAIEGMETSPWSPATQRAMVGQTVEGVQRAGQSALGTAEQSAANMGRSRGLWSIGRMADIGQQVGAEQAGATRQLDITRNLQENLNKMVQSQLRSQAYLGKQIPTMDWSSLMGPSMQYPMERSALELSAAGLPIQLLSSLGGGLFQSGAQGWQASQMPSPSAPSSGSIWGTAGLGALGSLEGASLIGAGKLLFLCVDPRSEIWTPWGPTTLGEVRVGDAVLGVDNRFHRVLAVDKGRLPRWRQHQFVRITTRETSLVITREHRIAGKPAGDWGPADSPEPVDGILSVEPAVCECGADIMLAGNFSYVCNSLPVNSMIGLSLGLPPGELVRMAVAMN